MVIFLTPLVSNFERIQKDLTKGSLGHAFTVNTCTESINRVDNWPYPQQLVSDQFVSTFVHLRYLLTDVPPQPNSPTESVPHQQEIIE